MTPEPYSESDTRQQLIDQRLRLAGWALDDPTQMIQELDMYVEDGKPTAVREPLVDAPFTRLHPAGGSVCLPRQ